MTSLQVKDFRYGTSEPRFYTAFVLWNHTVADDVIGSLAFVLWHHTAADDVIASLGGFKLFGAVQNGGDILAVVEF